MKSVPKLTPRVLPKKIKYIPYNLRAKYQYETWRRNRGNIEYGLIFEPAEDTILRFLEYLDHRNEFIQFYKEYEELTKNNFGCCYKLSWG